MNISRLQYPKTEEDWEMLQGIPDFSRRLAVASLKELLDRVVWGTIWSGRPVNLDHLKDAKNYIHESVIDSMSAIFKRGLPSAYERLGWAKKARLAPASYQEAIIILSIGFQELCKTKTVKGTAKPWPQGLDKDVWTNAAMSRGAEFRPVIELIDFWRKRLKPWAQTLLIHGSCATLDHIPGASDLDTVLVINRDTLCEPAELARCIPEIIKSQRYLFRFNPLMHHGHMLVTEPELSELREANFPLCLPERGVTFGSKPELILERDTDLETLFVLQVFQNFFEREITDTGKIRTSFDLLWWVSTSTFVPLLFLQMKTGRSRWKPDALVAVKEFLTEKETELIGHLTDVRSKMGPFMGAKDDRVWEMMGEPVNPGFVAMALRESARMDRSAFHELSLTDERIVMAQKMWERLNHEAIKIFCDKFMDKKKYYTSGQYSLRYSTVREQPVKSEIQWYNLATELMISLAQNMPEVKAVYQFGEIGCPGISDVDYLVVLHDYAQGHVPLMPSDFPRELREIVRHDPVLISEEALPLLSNVFPLFGAKKICGFGPSELGPTRPAREVLLPLMAVMQLAKYPHDIIYQARLLEPSFTTILAQLHSFQHYVRMLEMMEIKAPERVVLAVERDRQIRTKFLSGVNTSSTETEEIVDIILCAVVDMTRVIRDELNRLCGDILTDGLHGTLLEPSCVFNDQWMPEDMLTYCRERVLDDEKPDYPFPAELGWFVYWLSRGDSPLSKELAARYDVTVSHEHSAEVLASFTPFNNYRNTLDRFVDIESNHGRSVSKYITLINCPADMVPPVEKANNVFEPYRDKIQALERFLRESEDRIKWLDQEINNYANSMSWRITAPLRTIRGFLINRGGSR